MTKRKRSSSVTLVPSSSQSKRVRYDYSSDRRYSSSSNSSGHSALARYVSQGSGAALGFIAGNVPGAIYGANYAGQAYDATHPETPDFTSEMDLDFDAVEPLFRKNSSMVAGYGGYFKKPKKSKLTWDQKMLTTGAVIQEESFGKVTDNDAVYLEHSTWDTNRMSEVITLAILRKALKKAGLPVSDRHGIVSNFTPSSALGMSFVYMTQHPTNGTLTTTVYTSVAGDTLTSIATGLTGMTASILNLFTNATANIPFSFHIYQLDSAATNRENIMSKIDLTNEVFTLTAYSDVKIQNRTQGGAAAPGVNDVDRVDMQPLVGTIYEFSSEPKIKHAGITGAATSNADILKLQGVPSNGIRLWRAVDFTTSNSYQNRPPKNLWVNCKKTSNVVLGPGVIKKASIIHTIKGKLTMFIPKMRLEAFSGTPIPQVVGAKCKAQWIAFEEILRTLNENSVVVNYERKYVVGCTMKTSYDNTPIKPLFYSTNTNNPGP